MIIAIDFDGTIVEEKNYPFFGPEIKDSIKTIKDLYMNGYILILWTLREKGNLQIALNCLSNLGILHMFQEINSNIWDQVLKYQIDPRKIAADYYIDDRVIGWKGWQQVREHFKLDD